MKYMYLVMTPSGADWGSPRVPHAIYASKEAAEKAALSLYYGGYVTEVKAFNL